MEKYLREKKIKNITVNGDFIKEVYDFFNKRQRELNSDTSNITTYFFSLIRFDEKGYRLSEFEELYEHFNQAKNIQTLAFKLDPKENTSTERFPGPSIELTLDKKDPNSCNLFVAANNKEWVDCAFLMIQEILAKYKNKNSFAQTETTAFFVQLTGVIFGFSLCLWAATKLAPMLIIQNSFVMCFLFLILIFSNIWTHLNKMLLNWINRAFPSIKFYRHEKDHLHWISKAIISSACVAVAIWIATLIFSSLGKMLISLINKGNN